MASTIPSIADITISQINEFRDLLTAEPELYCVLRSKILSPDSYSIKNWVQLMKSPALANIIRDIPKFVYPEIGLAIRKVRQLDNTASVLIFCYPVQLYLVFENYLNYESFCKMLIFEKILGTTKLGQVVLDGQKHHLTFNCIKDERVRYRIMNESVVNNNEHCYFFETSDTTYQVMVPIKVKTFTKHETMIDDLISRVVLFDPIPGTIVASKIPIYVSITGDKYKIIKLDNSLIVPNKETKYLDLNLVCGTTESIIPKRAISDRYNPIITWIKLHLPSENQPASEYYEIYCNSGVEPRVAITVFGTLVRKAGVRCGKKSNCNYYNVPEIKKKVPKKSKANLGQGW